MSWELGRVLNRGGLGCDLGVYRGFLVVVGVRVGVGGLGGSDCIGLGEL